jgi:pimeloyl-ACP methyl ester carboxylesterase
MTHESKTIVLIHGLWMTPRSWDNFRGYYEDRGYRVLAPAWPGIRGEVEDVRRDPSALAGLGLREIFDYYAGIIRPLDEPPIIMGHSMGGLIVQLLIDRGFGAAGIAIDATATKGIWRLPLSVLRAARPVLANPLNYWRNVTLTFEQFQYAFANVMSEADARIAYDKYLIPGPGRPIFQAAFANFNPWAVTKVDYRNNRRAPLLLIGGAQDHLVNPILNRINLKKYARSSAITEYKEFPNRSHLIVGQNGWQEVAEFALTWAQSNLRERRSRLTASLT